ncbi:MAG: transposase [Candidatus Micrarchaeaceae archaeon]|jgi:putative transposase
MKAYKFRIYPDAKRQKEVSESLILAQQLYNKILEKIKSEYKNSKKFVVNKSTLNKYMKEVVYENKDFLKLYSQTRQDIFIRLQKAFQNFFKRHREKKQGRKTKAGFPRFKSADRYCSITYPQYNGSFSVEKAGKSNMLRIARIGRIKIDLHREISGTIKTMTIKKEAGKYYAIFTSANEIEITKTEDTNPVGIDLGLDPFVAMSDCTSIDKPKFVNERKKKLARWQKIVARRKKGSKRREKAKLSLQKEWQYLNNESSDFAHKLSNKLVNSGYTSFAVEDLKIQNMVKNHNLAASIYHASWNKFIQLLSYKAESAGLKVIKVDPRNTTKQCSGCGNIQDMPLSERIYICNRCGLRIDRQLNASINILKKATSGLEGSHAREDSVRPQNRAVVDEPRTYPVIAGEAPTFR